MRCKKHIKIMCSCLIALLLGFGNYDRVALAAVPTPANLMVPPAAYTDTTVYLLWDKGDPAIVKSYDVYRDGTFVANTTKPNYRVTGLTVSTSYSFTVKAKDASGNSSGSSNTVNVTTKAAPQVFNITNYGAVGDGSTVNTTAIQNAINACASGGQVYIPSGTFVTGAINLKSNMTLYLASGAVLKGSSNISDFPIIKNRFEGKHQDTYAALINGGTRDGSGITNVTITGPGTIDGNGIVLSPLQISAKGRTWRSQTILFFNSSNIYMQGVTVQNSPSWTIHPVYCTNVTTADVTVNTYDYDVQNGDGWDPDSSTYCYLFNSNFKTSDDCISLKSGADAEGRSIGKPTENIRITNCDFNKGAGLAIGSEMSGGIRHVLIQDCNFVSTDRGINFKTRRGRGGVVEDIVVKDITMPRSGDFAISINMKYNDNGLPVGDQTTTPIFRDMHFFNISCSYSRLAVQMPGLPESPITNVTMDNITMSTDAGLTADSCSAVTFTNTSLTITTGALYTVTNSTDFYINGVNYGGSSGTPTPSPTPTPTPNPQSIISNMSVKDSTNAVDWSVQANIQSGNTQYGDRAYKFVSVPSIVAGGDWIRTANDSKSYTGTPLVTFTVTRDATVYVALCDNISPKPSWLDSSWVDSGSNIINDESSPRTFSLYQKSYTANSTVSLGPNSNTTYSLYTVIVK